MRVLGVDPATLLAAVAHAEDGKLLNVFLWTGDKKDSQFRRLAHFHDWINFSCANFKPDLICIAESSYTRNMITMRALARAESVAIIAGMLNGGQVVTAKDTQIRSILWPDQKVKKENVYDLLKAQYPNFKWKRQDLGGQDQADAAAAALAGPVVLERKLK